jgi:hypothetical protein
MALRVIKLVLFTGIRMRLASHVILMGTGSCRRDSSIRSLTTFGEREDQPIAAVEKVHRIRALGILVIERAAE